MTAGISGKWAVDLRKRIWVELGFSEEREGTPFRDRVMKATTPSLKWILKK